jgi:hypothetical protein
MENPYAAPQFEAKPVAGQNSASHITPSSLVQQVRIFGILNAVQGGLELIMGLLFLFYAVFFPIMMSNPEFQQQQPDPPPKEFLWAMGIGFGVGAALLLAVSVARIAAGVMNWRFRGRGLAMFSIIGGAVTVLTCYCAPTSIAVLIYGLVVMLSPQVKQAFAMAAKGTPPEKLLVEFSPYGPNAIARDDRVG